MVAGRIHVISCGETSRFRYTFFKIKLSMLFWICSQIAATYSLDFKFIAHRHLRGCFFSPETSTFLFSCVSYVVVYFIYIYNSGFFLDYYFLKQ